MKQILVISIILLCVSVHARNIEQLDSYEQNTLEMLEALQWKSGLSKQEISIATNALTSSKDTVAEVALCVVVLHDVPGLKEILQRGSGSANGYSRLLSNAIIDGLEERQSAIESLRGHNLLKQVPKDAREEVMKKANHIIAIYVTRMLRSGEVPMIKWDDLQFSSFDRQLLLYSKRPSEKVIKEIVKELGQATVAGANEYDLIRVLNSYDEVGIDAVVDTLQDERTGVYGKVLLFSHIETRVSKMADEDRQKVKSVLRKEKGKDRRVERALKRVKKKLGNGSADTT